MKKNLLQRGLQRAPAHNKEFSFKGFGVFCSIKVGLGVIFITSQKFLIPLTQMFNVQLFEVEITVHQS